MAHCDCSDDATGWLLCQTYGEADIPEDWTPVQRCDTCERFESDEDAAAAAAVAHDTEVRWFPATPDPDEPDNDELHGEWAIKVQS